jgi:hypothetical protein
VHLREINVKNYFSKEKNCFISEQLLPSSFMPVFKHLSNLQAGHFFRVAMETGHLAPRKQT